MRPLALGLFVLSAVVLGQTPNSEDYTISGVVVDHLSNRPLNHVLVEITRVGDGGGDASVLTEADGRFTFVHVPKGTYALRAAKRGQQSQRLYETKDGFGTAIVVGRGAKTDGIVFPMRTDSSIRGTVLDDMGEPVQRAQIELLREGVMNGEAKVTHERGTGTNSSGQFHLAHLARGKYYVRVSASPWYGNFGTDSQTVYPVTFSGDTTDADSARAIVLKEGETATVQITVRGVPGIHVTLPGTGRRGVMLSVKGPGGVPISVHSAIRGLGDGGQNLYLSHGDVMRPMDQYQATRIELFDIPAGRYEVSRTGPDGQGQGAQTVDLDNGSTLSWDNAAATTATVTGRMIFDTPRPEGEILVTLLGNRRPLRAKVGTDGTFKFDSVGPGQLNIVQNSNAVMITSVEPKGAAMVRDALDVKAGATVDVTLHVRAVATLATLDGIVTKDSGETVPGATVLLMPEDLSHVRLIRRFQSELDGSFILHNVMPGKYRLIAVDDGEDLAFRSAAVIQPYMVKGLKVTVPGDALDGLKVLVQVRL